MPAQGKQQPDWQRVKFFEWLSRLCKELEMRQRELHRQRHLRTILNACYHGGHQRVSMLPNGTLLVSPPQNENEPVMSHNFFRPYIRQVTASWMDSHPTFDILPITDNDRERRHARREFQRLAQYFEREHLGHQVRERTALGAQLSASYGYEVFWDETQPRGEEWHEEYEPFSVPGKTMLDCYDCGEQMQLDTPEAPRACPKCGSENVLAESHEAIEGERLASEGYKEAGDVVIRLVQDGSTLYDMTVGKEASPYLCIFEDRPRTEIEFLFNQKFNVGLSNDQEDIFHPFRFLRNVGNTFNLMGSSA